MSKSSRKNGIVITALALMIIAAGYLNFTGQKITTNGISAKTTVVPETVKDTTVDISAEDEQASDSDAKEEKSASSKDDASSEDGYELADSGEVQASEEKVALKDTETGENKGKDTDSVSKKSESVLIKNNGDENPYVVSVTAPKIAGVAVVCEGADGGKKDSEIIEMIGALFDIESHKIKITRMTA